ncbi:MAG: RHS repeat protein [Saprospiraceae bacterium]|nr:RHS repeat protein [Pyrinomonadaceae bacterium]
MPLVSKTTYAYDEEDFAQETNQNISSVIQHDNTAFSASFIIGRGNQTSVTRHDVTGQTASVTSKVRYDIAGSPVAQIDPLNRKVKIDYSDVFNDAANRNAFAYPTTVTDPASNSSTVKYRYDTGTNVEANSPPPAGNTFGKKTKRTYNEQGQLAKNAVWIDTTEHAYTRYEYPTNGTQTKKYSTITDSNSDGVINSSDEVLSERFYDGTGRMRNSRSPMLLDAEGNTLSWVGQKLEYDITGRVKRQSAPTEVDNAWNPTNDDSSRGWQWKSQEFDWKGRVTRDIGLDGVDKLYSYEGCGCAGGEITTIMGELVDGERRTQKIYADILGRTRKTEVLDYEDNVYSPVVKTFNGRGQPLSAKQFQGAEGSSTFQETTFTYDGHGRLITKHEPQQDANEETIYSYNVDDRPQSITDGRGASSSYTYNNRGLVERIDHSLPEASTNFPTIIPNSAVAAPTPPLPCGPEHPDYPDCEEDPTPTPTPTPNPQPYLSWVTFNYDALGNRTQMADSETGTINYEYDQLSRMTAEHKIMRAEWNLTNSTFSIGYGYDLTGRLTSVTDPFGERIDYKSDKIGRLKQITGTPFSSSSSTAGTVDVTDYIDNIEYRAWGAVKSIDYGNSTNMSQTFDSDLRVDEFRIWKDGQSNSIIKKNYQYYNDNRVKFSSDSGDTFFRADSHYFDRSYAYDHMGRLTEAETGAEARGETGTPDRNLIPYKHNYTYNAFGNVTSRSTYTWTADDDESHIWTNNRVSNWIYDADGRVKQTPENKYYYDASGEVVMSTLYHSRRQIRHLDGEGKSVRQNNYNYLNYSGGYVLNKTEYFIYSTVLGKLLTEVKSDGTKKKTNVYGIGGVVAAQNTLGSTMQHVAWEYLDPSKASYIAALPDGGPIYGGDNGQAELDPLGSDVGLSNPDGGPLNPAGPGTRWGDPFGGYSCRLDGFETSCSQVMYVLSIGAGYIRDVGVPWGIPGRWEDIDDPNTKPSPGSPQGTIVAVGTISVFTPASFFYDWDFSQEQLPHSQPPTITPISTEPPDNPDCWTVNLLLREQRVLDAFETARKASAKSGNENGGFMFVDLQSGDVHIFEASEGLKDEMPNLYKEIGAKAKSLAKGGRPYAFLTMYHTHPNGGRYASTPDISSFRDDRMAFVIYPEGNPSGPLAIYDGSWAAYPKGSQQFDRCLLSYSSK